MPRGLTLVEVLVTVAVVGIIAVGILGLLQMGLYIVGDDKARNGALALAEDTLELVKNLPYENVGTVGGVPAGALAQSEARTINNIPYTLATDIRYIDDPLDSLAPQDTAPHDYKRVRVEVSWTSRLSGRGFTLLSTDISPPGLETELPGGTIMITVKDGTNAPVPQAHISIAAPTAQPPVTIVTTTDDAGTLILPGSPPCAACYHITATKTGFSQDFTTSPETVAQPARPDLSVTNGSLVTSDFRIDRTGDMTVITKQYDRPTPINNVGIVLEGSKILGHDAQNFPVPKFTGNYTTGSGGRAVIPALEADSYQISLANNSGYDLAEADPLLPLSVPVAGSASITLLLAPHTTRSLRVAVTDQGGAPLNTATITLTPDGGSPTQKTTSPAGQVFFSDIATSGGHTLTIEKNGWQTQTLEIDITTNQYVHVPLAPS